MASRKRTAKPAKSAGPTHLILTCMDYRHMDDLVHEVSEKIEGEDAYDHLIVPGASLGVVQETHPEWRDAFWTQLAVARKLHGATIRHVWIIEHMDCGAYRAFLGGGRPIENEELMHRAMASLVEGAIARWCERPDIAWPVTVARKIMRPAQETSKVWTLHDLDRLP